MNLSAILPNIKAFLARYSLQQKLSMVGAAGLVIVLTWSLVYFVNRVSFQVLYSDVDPAEAQSIVTRLQGMQTPYELSEDGRTIRVPSDKLAEIRIQLASEGLPESGHVGFEIFDRSNFGITNFQEQVNYQRALEGELARSILTLNEVAAARVHLVLAKDSLYEKSEEQSKASVVLKLKSGRSLSDSGIQGIENLIASAVKGLAPDKVAVIDYRGKMLSRSEAQNSMTGQQLDMQQSIEAEMSNKILRILEPAVGAGKVKPQVSVALNFQQVDETQENYDPKAVVVSSQRVSEPGAISAIVGGIVGVNKTPAPAPVATPAPAAAANGTAVPPTPTTVGTGGKQSEVVNYEVSKSIRHIVNPVGKIERLSVAVVLDNQTESKTDVDGKVAVKSTPRTPDEMKKYSDLVAAAIAYNPERGDLLNVVNIPFESENAAESVKEPSLLEKQIPSILIALRYITIPIAFILIYFLFIRPVQKSVMAGWIPVTASGDSPRGLLRGGVQTPLTVRQLEARLASGASPSESEIAAAEEQDLLPMPGPSRIDLIRKRVVEQAEQNPETMARLVRVWLNEEKNK